MAHNPLWAAQFDAEVLALSELLGSALIAAHHMGSTAIPNIPAKPVIDILLEVTSLGALDDGTQYFEDLGYDPEGEYGIEGRRYFSKRSADDGPGYHVHAYKAGDFQVRRHLAFRDYLRMKPEIAKEYADLKRRLSDEQGVLVDNYQTAKKAWVGAITLEAMREL